MKKCYTIAIPNLPNPVTHPALAKKTARFLKKCEGLLGVHPHYPEGTILFFDTLENAKAARWKFMSEGNKCGDYIMNAEMRDDGSVVVNGVAEQVGWSVKQ